MEAFLVGPLVVSYLPRLANTTLPSTGQNLDVTTFIYFEILVKFCQSGKVPPNLFTLLLSYLKSTSCTNEHSFAKNC